MWPFEGGYAGFGAADPDARDLAAYETELAGDLGESGHAYNVVSGLFCEINTLLDGVTVTGASYSALAYGRLTITDCTFTDNHTASFGGALLFVSGTLDRCKFIGNSAEWGGGAIFTDFSSDLAMTDCQFTGNTAGTTGGAVDGSSPMGSMIELRVYGQYRRFLGRRHSYFQFLSIGCRLCIYGEPNDGNGLRTAGRGAVMHEYPGTNSYIQCLFVANSSPTGGAVYSGDESVLEFINCTLAGNAATNGRAMACDAQVNPSDLTITNCILWDGGAEIVNNDGSTITVSYSDIQGGWAGTGNLNADPLFVRAPAGADRGDLHLQAESPCLNVGNTAAVPASLLFDLDGSPRVNGAAVDMGVYELAGVTLVDITPDTLNKKSNGQWVTAYITLPTGIDLMSIDFDTLVITRVEGTVGSSCDPDETDQPRDFAFTPQVGDHDEDGIPDLAVKFDRQKLQARLCLDDQTITVSGLLKTGEPFHASDTIRVIERGK